MWREKGGQRRKACCYENVRNFPYYMPRLSSHIHKMKSPIIYYMPKFWLQVALHRGKLKLEKKMDWVLIWEKNIVFNNILMGKANPKDRSSLCPPKKLGGECWTKWGSHADYNGGEKKKVAGWAEWNDMWKEINGKTWNCFCSEEMLLLPSKAYRWPQMVF